MVRLSHVEIAVRDSSLLTDGRLAAMAAALLTMLSPASAQTAAPSRSPPGISERTLRDAASPFRWIKIHSETARKAEEARKAEDAKKSAAAAPAPAPRAVTTRSPSRPAADAPALAVAALAPVEPASRPAPPTSPPTSPPAPQDSEPHPGADEALVAIDKVDPEWDEELLRSLRKGRVLVRFHVAEDGYLSRIQIVESSHSKLTGPAMAAVMQWRFEPVPEPRVATVEFGFDVDTGRR